MIAKAEIHFRNGETKTVDCAGFKRIDVKQNILALDESRLFAEEMLIQRLQMIAPDHVERAITEARRHAETTLCGTFPGYLEWCIERGKVGAPMPWIDDSWELRWGLEMLAGGDFGAFRDLRIAFDRWGDVFWRFAPEIARNRRLRSQSWQRRRTGRAVK